MPVIVAHYCNYEVFFLWTISFSWSSSKWNLISCINGFILNENIIIDWLIIVIIIIIYYCVLISHQSTSVSFYLFHFNASHLFRGIFLLMSVNIFAPTFLPIGCCDLSISAHWFFKLELILESTDEISPKNVCCVWEMPVSHPFCRSLVLNSKPSFPYPMLFRQTIQGCK